MSLKLPLVKEATDCRWLLLCLLAGHLLLRQAFAHLSLGQISNDSIAFRHAYITEGVLLLLLPFAAAVAWRRHRRKTVFSPCDAELGYGLGTAFYLGLALLVWGIFHAFYSLRSAESLYLVARQSMLAGYVIFFLYAFLFFGDQQRFVREAVLAAVVTALVCVALDTGAWFRSEQAPDAPDNWLIQFRSLYGQQTIPLAILGLGLMVVYCEHWGWRALALAGLAVAGWRQAGRFQSAPAIAIAGALGLYLVLGVFLALRSQVDTLKRGLLLLLLFGSAGGVYLAVKKAPQEDKQEVQAWGPRTYLSLMEIYDQTQPKPDDYVFSTRTGMPVNDPEVIKLNAVSDAAETISVRNNIWRFLVWRRMACDWWNGSPILGAGVGHKWTYEALYHTSFDYGDDQLGLDPHNSFLSLLYRYGLIGLLLLAGLAASVFYYVIKALSFQDEFGDVLLEGIVLYFFYTVVFACFVVSLEGPSYSMPFWTALGLAYARARQRLYVKQAMA